MDLISARIDNMLYNERLTGDELADRPDRDLLRIPNFGKRSLAEFRKRFGYGNGSPPKAKLCARCPYRSLR